MRKRMRRRAEPEPNGTDVLFALSIIAVVIASFVFLLDDVTAAFARAVMANLAGCTHR